MIVVGSMDHGNLLEREICIPELPSFQIRRFVSSVRSIDLFKCWPFRQKILEKSLNLGLKPLLPPFDLSPKVEERLLNKHVQSSQNVPHEAGNVNFRNQNQIDDECTDGSGAVEIEAQSEVAQMSLPTPDSTTSGVAHVLPPILVSERSSDLSNDNVGACAINMTSDILDSVISEVEEKSGPMSTFNPEKGVHDLPVDLLKEIDNIGQLGEASQEMPETSIKRDDTSKQTNGIEQECSGLQNNLETAITCEDLSFTDLNMDVLIQVCPVCLSFTSTSNTTLNAHIDHCLESVLPSEEGETRSCKSRMKPRKMRSMVEICAEAPRRTLEDLERSSEQWNLDGKISDGRHSSYDDGHASIRRYNVLRVRQLGKAKSTHNRSTCKRKEAPAVDQPSAYLRLLQQRNLNTDKRLKNDLQGNMRSRHAFDAESEEQCHEQTHLHFAGFKSRESLPEHSKKQPVIKSGLQERNAQGDAEDDECAPDEDGDLQWLRRLDTTVLDTSADEEKRLKKLRLRTKASYSDTNPQEQFVMGHRPFGSSKESPPWMAANGKHQMKMPFSDKKKLDQSLKKRKLQEKHVDGMHDNGSRMIAEDVRLDLQAEKSQRNKSIHKGNSVVTVGASASHDMNRDVLSAGMKAFSDGLKGGFDRDACSMQGDMTTGSQLSGLKCISSEIQKTAKSIDQAKNKRRLLENCDSSTLSEHSKAHERVPITLDAVDERGIVLMSSIFSADESTTLVSHKNDNAVKKQQISSLDNAYEQPGQKFSEGEQNILHASQEKQILDSDRLRIVQMRAANGISAPEFLRSQSLNDESCGNLVELVRDRCSAGHFWSQESIVTSPEVAVEPHVNCDDRRLSYRNESSSQQLFPTSDRTLLPEVAPYSQSDDVSIIRGYAPILGGFSSAVGATKQNVLLNLKSAQSDIAASRVSMNVSSQRPETPAISKLEARSSQRFSGNSCPKKVFSNNHVYNGEHVRSDPYNVAWANGNQHFYQKDIGIMQTKCHVGYGESQKQSHSRLIKGFQDSVDIGVCSVTDHNQHNKLTSRILTSNTIPTSEPTVRFENNQVNQREIENYVSVSSIQKGRMSNLLDDLTRSMDGKSMRVQNSVPTRCNLRPTTESFSQHMRRDLHAVFPSENGTCQKTNGHIVHPQFLQPISHAGNERRPVLVTEFVNSSETIEAYKGKGTSSTPNTSRSITFARMNGRTGITEESLKSYNAVDYSGDQGVVHIFGNPVFKLMGRNVMVANNNIKPLAIENSIDQNGGHRFYPSSSLSCLPESHSQRYYPPEMFASCFHGDSSKLGDHSFMLGNTTIRAGDLQRASSSKFSQFGPSLYNNNGISTCHIQVEKGQSLQSIPEIHLKQQQTVASNTRKQAAECCSSDDCSCKGGNNSLLKPPNTMLIHNESQPKAHSQDFHSSLSSHMLRGSAVNGYRQQSGTLADIVQSSERKTHRSVSFAGRNF